MSVGQPQSMLLNEFGELVQIAFGTQDVYHVGSSMGEEKSAWRDVDVRLLLSVEAWAKLELSEPTEWATAHGDPKWRALCIVWSHYGRHMTGLPIDFQIQRLPEANKLYPRGGRSWLGTINYTHRDPDLSHD